MAQPTAQQQLHTAPLSIGSLRALKNVKVMLQPSVSHANSYNFLQSLDSKSNVTSLDFSHDGTHLVLADENET